MITGHAVSHLEGNARIWILTVNEMPTPGALIQWDEPAVGNIPAQTGVRGWLSSEESTHPDTQILIVAGGGSRWVRVVTPLLTLPVGVSNVDRGPAGTRYLITKNIDSRIAVGSVLINGDDITVRDWQNAEVSANQKALMLAAVRAYQSWAERH